MTRAMRRMRKYLLVVACIALVAGIAIGGTIAWLADSTKTVTNTFDPKNLDVELTENGNGQYNIIPGTEETKDPTVTATAEVDSYVFVKITETDMGNSGLSFDDYITYNVVDTAAEKAENVAYYWTKLENAAEVKDNETVYYCLIEVDEAADQSITAAIPVLYENKVSYSEDITKTDMDELAEAKITELKLTFKSYMIQAAGMENDPATAWATVSAEYFPGVEGDAEGDFSGANDTAPSTGT